MLDSLGEQLRFGQRPLGGDELMKRRSGRRQELLEGCNGSLRRENSSATVLGISIAWLLKQGQPPAARKSEMLAQFGKADVLHKLGDSQQLVDDFLSPHLTQHK